MVRYFNRIDIPRYTSKWNRQVRELTGDEIYRKVVMQTQMGNCVACFYSSHISDELMKYFSKKSFNVSKQAGYVQFSWSIGTLVSRMKTYD